ncbi:MAG: hypothetical protein WAW88_02365 [Nocardioides sp.]
MSRPSMRRSFRRLGSAVTGLVLATTLAACGSSHDGHADHAGGQHDSAGADGVVDDHSADYAKPVAEKQLRPGERRLTLAMEEPYTPKAPTGVGTDDYRCFLLDPELTDDVFLTGTHVLPGNPQVVHHVILFRVPPDKVATAETVDSLESGPGWTCFGDTRLGEGPQLDDAPWIGAWAPGSEESVQRKGYGVRLEAGSRVVMQVHYNLLEGAEPDVSAASLRVTDVGGAIKPIRTMLMPAPVELPCRPGHRDSPLCDRAAAVEDVKARFGVGPGSTNDLLYLLCGGSAKPRQTTSCVRTIGHPTKLLAVAGHMHLLGTSIKVEVNPGTPRARTVLDIPIWDFDNQGAQQIKPVVLQPFDTVKVTCTHSQELRDRLPAFAGQPDRYVVWGEGTTDEMCLAILQTTAA